MKQKKYYRHGPLLTLAAVLLTGACNPVDRSGEEPFAPTVRTVGCEAVADSFRLTGQVLLSPNSRVLERGFEYGNDTMKVTVEAYDTTDVFHGYTRVLEPGRYYFVAYARNGIGTSRGDTLQIDVP